MSTHGDIEFIDANDGKRKVWLHAYHTGHTGEAIQWLIDMPKWVVEQARLVHAKKISPDAGPWWGSILWREDRTPAEWKGDMKHFERQPYVSQLCYAPGLAALMIRRGFERWLPVPEEDASWHEVGQNPDLRVTCNQQQGLYVIEYFEPDLLEDRPELQTADHKITVHFEDEVISMLSDGPVG